MAIEVTGVGTFGIGKAGDGQVYMSPTELAKLLKPIVVIKGREFSEVSRRMATLLKDNQVHSYASLAALADDLITTVSYGQAAQDRGERLEIIAAAHMGGWVPTSRKIQEWLDASGVDANYVKDNGSADPDLKSTTGLETVKVDVWSADSVGIVGTAGKEKNLEKFVKICRDLARICIEHGLTPRVYAYNSSQELLRAAAGAVGDENVFTIDGGGNVAPYA